MKVSTLQRSFFNAKISTLTLALAMTSCGGVGQDEGSPSASNIGQTFQGRAIDGYLARASVYIDTNNNGTRDSWEPFAFTDNSGYFSYNPTTQTDYCASDTSDSQSRYCLYSELPRQSAVIRIEKGYDIYTGEPFAGQLSKRLSNIPADNSSVDALVVTPITTLLTHTETNQQRTQLVEGLGLQPDDANIDYLNSDGNGLINHRLLNTATKVHKTVTVLADRITDQYTDIGEEFGTPNDATASVYQNLADTMLSSNKHFQEVVDNSDQIQSVIRRTEDKIREIYEQRDFDLPQHLPNNAIARASQVSQSISQVVDRLIDPNNGSSNDHKRVRGMARTVETAVIKALREGHDQSAMDNIIEFITNSANSDLVAALQDALSEDDADVSGLAGHSFAPESLASAEDISRAARIGSQAETFSSLGGKQIKISDLDLGFAPHSLRDLELEMYFSGSSGDTQGTFTACGKFIEDAHADGTLGEGNTRGEMLKGSWSLLNPSADQTSYNILLHVEFLGAKYSALMKSVGPTTIGEETYKQIRFDHDGEYRVWHSEQGLVDTQSVPTSHKECENRLPSRVGL